MFSKKGTDKPIPKKKLFFIDIAIIIVGSFLYAVSTVVFSAPNNIAPGGVSGIAIMINFLFPDINIGMASFVMNIPLVIVGFWKLGKEFMIKTFISLISYTVFADYVLAKVPVYTGNMLLASVFGGVLIGLGLGLIMWRAGSSGGTDIVCKLLLKAMPHLKLGAITFAVDCVVLLCSAFVYGSLEAVLYALINVFVASKCIDMVMYGFDVSKTMFIVSEHGQEIASYITDTMERGATLLEAKGAYTGDKKPFIISAVSQSEYVTLARKVRSIDPKAFIIVMTSAEIYGEGFLESLEK